MKLALLTAMLILLIAFSTLVTITNDPTQPSEDKTNSAPTSAVLPAASDDASTGTADKAQITQHKITPVELDTLKNTVGVYAPDQNYTQLVDGYGTGMRPPTEAEWEEIGANSYIVDSVNYQAGDGGPVVAVDLSATPWFPPIGNQGSQGSCVTWSVAYYTKTFQEAKEHGWDLSAASWSSGQPTLSYQDKIMSPAFVYNLINGGVDAGSSYQDAMRLVCFIGDCSWAEMPYNPSVYTAWPSESAWTEAAFYRGNSSGFQSMYVNTDAGLTNLKNWIASGHLATISVDADQYPNLTSADVWTLDNYVNPVTNHANTIVGYNDSISYVENGTVYYGAFKVANSWGIGHWEKVPDGFYWISYEALKQRVGSCMFYYDMINYQPQLLATFEISHEKRSECNIMVGMGNPDAPDAAKSFSQYVRGGTVPFPANSIVMDITDLINDVPNVYGKLFWLRVRDDGSDTVGNVTRFAVDHEESQDAPCQTEQGEYIYLNVTLSFGQILVNSRVPPSTPNQTAPAGGNISLYFGGVQWSSPQLHILVSRDNFSQVSAADTTYTPWFTLEDLNASAVTAYTSADGAWQIGYNWVNGTTPKSIAAANYYFKASDGEAVEFAVSDTSITVTGALQATPTAGSAGSEIAVSGYGFPASSTVNITYLNPVTSTWTSIANNTATDASGHFTYNTATPDLRQNQPAGDNPAVFDPIVFRVQDSFGAYCNATAFKEYRRGLTQVGDAAAAGLYGNGSDLTAAVQVAAGHQLVVVGNWFAPGDVAFLWDGDSLGTAAADEAGVFNTTLTVPAASPGSYTLRILDAGAELQVTVTVVPSPETSDDYDGSWHAADFTITLTCADDGSGVGATYYRINNGLVKSIAVDGQPLITAEGANNILEYWSVDGAGVEELPHKMLTPIKLDKTPPSGSLTINDGDAYTNSNTVTLTLTAADTSGVAQARFSNDGVWDTEHWQPFATAESWVLTSGDGLKTVYCQIQDNAGFVSTFNSSITLDTTNPVAQAGQDQTVTASSTVTFDAGDCTDIEGVASYHWDFGDGTTGTGKTAIHTYSNPGTYTATLTVQDAAGNTATSSLTVTVQADVIPEFPPAALPLLFAALSLFTAVIYSFLHRISNRLQICWFSSAMGFLKTARKTVHATALTLTSHSRIHRKPEEK
jgi:hypothetical protein